MPSIFAVVFSVVSGPRTRRATAAVTIFMFDAGARAASGSSWAIVLPVATSATTAETCPCASGEAASEPSAEVTAALSTLASAFHDGSASGAEAEETLG